MMKKTLLQVAALTILAGTAILVIALRHDLFTQEQVNDWTVRSFASLVGLAFALAATLPLSYRGRRVKRVRKMVSFGPLLRTERRRNRRLWIASLVILGVAAAAIGWWQLFDQGDLVMTTWALCALAVAYLILIPFRRPVELDQIKSPQSPKQMLWAVGDPGENALLTEE